MHIWLAPDGHRYTITLLQEPFDRLKTIVFRTDGWIGAVGLPASVTLMNLGRDELERALEYAKTYG